MAAARHRVLEHGAQQVAATSSLQALGRIGSREIARGKALRSLNATGDRRQRGIGSAARRGRAELEDLAAIVVGDERERRVACTPVFTLNLPLPRPVAKSGPRTGLVAVKL